MINWIIDPEAAGDYFPAADIPVDQYKDDYGNDFFILYSLQHHGTARKPVTYAGICYN